MLGCGLKPATRCVSSGHSWEGDQLLLVPGPEPLCSSYSMKWIAAYAGLESLWERLCFKLRLAATYGRLVVLS